MILPTKQILHPLKGIFFANSIFSGISGVSFIVFARALYSLFGLPSPLLVQITGGILILFSVYLLFLVNKKVVSPIEIWFIIMSDFSWVIGTLYLLFTFPTQIAIGGKTLLYSAGVTVLTFTLMQIIYTRNSNCKK